MKIKQNVFFYITVLGSNCIRNPCHADLGIVLMRLSGLLLVLLCFEFENKHEMIPWFMSSCRSISLATPCHAPMSKRPRHGHPGHPSISLTMAATTSNASATRAKPASRTRACWKWVDRGSRCVTAPVMDPLAAPLMVSALMSASILDIKLSVSVSGKS